MRHSSQKLPKLSALMGELIALPSVSSVSPTFDMGNLAVIERLADWCESLGMTTEILPVSEGKANLLATLGDGPGGLVLSGHTDTVPFDDGLWQSDPFSLTEREQKFYGLGSADMKSFLAMALSVIESIDAQQLAAPIILLATADEESTMAGAKALVEAGKPSGRKAIIGEPTSLHPIYMHKGIMMEAIHIQGQSGHSSDPKLGNNAMEGMHQVIDAILAWRKTLQIKHHNDAFAVPVPTLNLGHIHGGDNPNRICADCHLHIDLRPLPGMAIDELRNELKQRAEQAIANTGLQLTTEALFNGVPAMQSDADSELVKTAERLTGYTAEAVAFGTEAPFLQQLDNDVIVLGPGNIDQAHQPDEYLSLHQINPMLDILQQFIGHYCLTDKAA